MDDTIGRNTILEPHMAKGTLKRRAFALLRQAGAAAAVKGYGENGFLLNFFTGDLLEKTVHGGLTHLGDGLTNTG